MIRNFTFKPDDTITGYFKKIRPGDTYHIAGEVNYNAVRLEAYRRNKEARTLGKIGKKQVLYSVSKEMKKGCVTIMHNDNAQ